MDIEKLIGSVKSKRPLWDKKNKNYHNKDIIKKLWKEISVELNVNEIEARQRWRGLRDNFRKEVAKLNKARRGDRAQKAISKWQHFESLSFVKDQFAPRKTIENLETVLVSYETESLASDGFETTEEEQYEEEKPISSNRKRTDQNNYLANEPQVNPLKKVKSARNSSNDKLLDIDCIKLKDFLEYTENTNRDDDYHFAMSIVPFMRRLPITRKLSVRSKILEILSEEETRVAAHSYD